MNSKQRKTLKKIWEHPPRQDIKWQSVLNLIEGCGGRIGYGASSRVKFFLNGKRGYFHSPHKNGSNMDKGAVADLKKFLENAGVTPEGK